MKYGESTFDILYLIFAVAVGISILCRRRDAVGRLMGSAVLILGIGDAFHLVPRVLNYFVNADFTAWLGIGKLVTSVTMTVFYLLLYLLWVRVYDERENRTLSAVVYALTAVRALLCLLPQNNWLENESSALWGVVRNIPFVALGCVIVWLYFKKRSAIRTLSPVWLLVTGPALGSERVGKPSWPALLLWGPLPVSVVCRRPSPGAFLSPKNPGFF